VGKKRNKGAANNRINDRLAKAAPLRYAPFASRLCGALKTTSSNLSFSTPPQIEDFDT